MEKTNMRKKLNVMLLMWIVTLLVSLGELAINNCCLFGIYEPELPDILRKDQ
ncbi:cyclic lactone autoinducer peptide [Carnobacterium divergens]|uniref:Cyclic lactone autoinducer peptide n=1 Tax=Carnobacterium divergens TaxID=2748 RepID=A0AAW8RG51_CARDV|nr:cyclic lactone autoinducer peptide [Carnobacterium divergens]MDT1959054.1 cyclic lactone autoinducer peptide [Carnobacterium divergens]MDT1975163.1 cyclic lactone autoinducer peptide [Carnobacterium divergens]